MRNLIIIGTGGHARPVVEIAQIMQSSEMELVGCIDINYLGQEEHILGAPVIGGMDKLSEYSADNTDIFVAIGDNAARKNSITKLRTLGYGIFTLTHPTAILPENMNIGDGSLVCAGAIINPGVIIGEGCIINTGAIIDHETIIDGYAHIAPGVKIAGRVNIGESAFIGIGSVIIDKVKVGNQAKIGAGSVILDDVASNETVVGLHKKKK